jgi:transposase
MNLDKRASALHVRFKLSAFPLSVATPSHIPRPVAATNKTDSLDCCKLAEYAAVGLLRAIAIPSEPKGATRVLVQRRHQVADSIHKVKRRIRGLLLVTGTDGPLRDWTLGQDGAQSSTMPYHGTGGGRSAT